MKEPELETDVARPVDDDVTAQLVANHREFLAFLERRVGSRSVAEDILQESFRRGLARLSTLRDGEAAVPWFYRILRNATVDYFRRRSAADRALARFAEELESAEEPSPSVHQEICQCVGRLADTLKPAYAEALKRIDVDGLAVHEFAVEAGITKGNAAVRVFRAREALRRQVIVACGTCAEHGCLSCSCGLPA